MSFSEVEPQHVHEAMAEFDERGREEFLAAYGFPTARDHLLVHDGRSYDAKAVLGVAHLRATGRPVTVEDFSGGGKDGAAKVLRDLGFEVRGPREGWATVAVVGSDHARATWALAARQRLVEAAGTYQSVVTDAELAEHVQERSRIGTTQQFRHWLGDVLARVTEECVRRGEPVLAALCVDAEGRVAKTYPVAVSAHRGEAVPDPDEHAAHERLDCYTYFRAPLPPGGGEPYRTVRTRTPRPRAAAAAPRTRATQVASQPGTRSGTRSGTRPRTQVRPPAQAAPKVEPPPAQVCPVHFTVLPSHGRCDYCD